MMHRPFSCDRLPPALFLAAACSLASCAGTGGLSESGTRAVATGSAAPRGPLDAFTARFAPLDLPPPNEFRLATGAPGPAYWQQRVDYAINAKLLAPPASPAPRVEATATITYTNNSPTELREVWFTLEQNHFRPGSDGSQLASRSARFGNRERFDGGYDIREFSLVSPAGASKLSPAVFGTVARVDLPEAIPARGGQATFQISWAFNVPPYGDDRHGILDTPEGPVIQVAQWIPAPCVYDDVHGWNTLPFLGQGEFYTNFGDFDVAITVPRDHVVAGGGELLNAAEVLSEPELGRLAKARTSAEPVMIVTEAEVGGRFASMSDNKGRHTWRFRLRNARTFAWASSPAFVWDACTISAASATAQAVTSDVLVQSVYPKSAAGRWGLDAKDGGSTRMLRDSILHYGPRWYPYQYSTAINVAGTVGGMEYPTIIFCSSDAEHRGLFGVTTHEIGHNWFPMVVNTDERRYAWMDEGFNTFMNGFATEERYPDEQAFGGRGGARDYGRRTGRARDGSPIKDQPIFTPADFIQPGNLGRLQYGKTAVGLRILRDHILGPDRFDHAFREYIRRWAFKSPQPADFFRTMEDAAGSDLAWFWRGWFMTTGTLDQAVVSVQQPDRESPVARVTFRTSGGLVMPLSYRVTYADGSTEDRRLPVQVWALGDEHTAWWDTTLSGSPRRIESVVIDPEELLPDTNLANNTW